MTYQLNPIVEAVAEPPVAEVHAWIRGRRFPADRPLLDVAQAVPSYPPAPELRDHLAQRVGEDDTSTYTEIVGLGSSAISDIGSAYAQNHRRLASYYEAVDAGGLPVERGIALDQEDQLRRYVITELMCNGRLRAAEVAERFGIDMTEHFAPEIAELGSPGGLIETGFVRMSGTNIEATPLGRPFIRNVAMAFDTRLRSATPGEQVFSRTV